MPKSCVLVTGGCGYLGSRLIRDMARDRETENLTIRIFDNLQSGGHRALLDLPKGVSYEFLEADILDDSSLRLALRGVDTVVHLAGIVSTPVHFANSRSMEQINHWGTARLIESCLEAGVKRFVYTSSTAVYGSGGPFHETDACQPFGYYARSIWGAEQSVLAASERGLDSLVLRLGSFFGCAPVMRFDNVVNKFALLAGIGRSLSIFGNGGQRRPVLHVADASDAIRHCLALRELGWPQVLNVVGTNVSVLELSEIICRLRSGTSVRYTDQDAILTRISVRASGEALATLGWRPRYSVENGIEELLSRLRNVDGVRIDAPLEH